MLDKNAYKFNIKHEWWYSNDIIFKFIEENFATSNDLERACKKLINFLLKQWLY